MNDIPQVKEWTESDVFDSDFFKSRRSRRNGEAR